MSEENYFFDKNSLLRMSWIESTPIFSMFILIFQSEYMSFPLGAGSKIRLIERNRKFTTDTYFTF